MRLLKDEGNSNVDRDQYAFPRNLFAKVVRRIIGHKCRPEIREEFSHKYVDQYDDLRYFTYTILA